MADPVSQALQFWGGLDFNRPYRDQQIADMAEQLSEHKQAFQQTRKTESALGTVLSDALAPGGSLAPSPAPPPSDTGSAMTYRLPSPPPIVGTPQPLTPPAMAPGQPSMPSATAATPGVFPQGTNNLTAPSNPQALALIQALTRAHMPASVTVKPPGAAPTAAPAASATSAPPSAAPGSPAPASQAGWTPMPKPMTGEGIGTTPEGGPSIGGRAIEPTKMPSVANVAARLKKANVDPITMFESLQQYSKMEDEESKKALAAARVQAEVYRAAVTAANNRLKDLEAQRKNDIAEANLKEKKREFEDKMGTAGGSKTSGYSGPQDELRAKGAAYNSGQPLTQLVPGWGSNPRVVNDRNAVYSEALRQRREENPSETPEQGGAGLARSQLEYKGEQGVIKDFTSGPTSRNIVQINQGIGHMGTMLDLAQALDNGDLQAENRFVNYVREQTGDPNVTTYPIAIGAVSNELMRIFRQVGASETETAAWEAKFSRAQSPAQIREGLRTAARLLNSRISATNNAWKRGMHTTEDFPGLLDPHSQEVLQRLGVGKGTEAKTSPANGKSPPAAGTIKDGYMFNGGDPSKKENWSKVK